MLQAKRLQTFVPFASTRADAVTVLPAVRRCRTLSNVADSETSWRVVVETDGPLRSNVEQAPKTASVCSPQQPDPLYLFACHINWEQQEDPGAAWELIAAARSVHEETRAHAQALLAGSRHLGGMGLCEPATPKTRLAKAEDEMKTPKEPDIIEDCAQCAEAGPGTFCDFSRSVLDSLSGAGERSKIPAGGILFAEGQKARGVFIVCSGKVNLTTTSLEGKTLLLKAAGPGEALGLSATLSGMPFESTAEAGTPCIVNFIDRKRYLELMHDHNEIGMHTAHCLSRDYQSAHRDIHDLVLTRSSTGKLARLLLSQAMPEEQGSGACRPTPMTHQEMAMRIGASRETVTRLLTILRRKRLIRLDGPLLVIRDRKKLAALTV